MAPARIRSLLQAATVAAAICACSSMAATVLDTTSEEDREAITKLDFACPEGAVEKVERWGSQGWSRGCYAGEDAEGRFLYWEQGYLNLVGFFSGGQKDGVWTVYNVDGTVYVKITFDKGVKKGKEVFVEPWK